MGKISKPPPAHNSLAEQALIEGERIYVDGSSRCIQGKRMSGYVLIDVNNMQTIEKGKLPSNWSAQTCELYVLKRALEYLKHKKGTIYTDSIYVSEKSGKRGGYSIQKESD